MPLVTQMAKIIDAIEREEFNHSLREGNMNDWSILVEALIFIVVELWSYHCERRLTVGDNKLERFFSVVFGLALWYGSLTFYWNVWVLIRLLTVIIRIAEI